ncbi:MAG: SGNH/GDSL hydrolase family protein [Ramlibacter sp.]
MDSVVVFGDSLSDIGRKWKTKSGKMATATNQMYVNPSGRFSDCRNWCDYMIEAATGQPQVTRTAEGTIALSKMHIELSEDSLFGSLDHPFQYVNYAEGGACGDKPASKGPFLSTFKDEVDWFEEDLRKNPNLQLGNTLFIVWFGANDLYTAGRKAVEMRDVANMVGNTQRARLQEIVRGKGGKSRFVFCNLARALTSVRYTKQLQEAENALLRALNNERVATVSGGRASSLWHAQQALAVATARRHTGDRFTKMGRAIREIEEKIALIKNFEVGVMAYNTQMAINANAQGDMVAEVGNVLNEETIARLFEGNYGLMAGAMTGRATQVSSTSYASGVRPITTIDEVHPTDALYKLIWEEIYSTLKRQQTTFGRLVGTPVISALARESGPNATVSRDFASVMDQIKSGNFQLRPVTRPRR